MQQFTSMFCVKVLKRFRSDFDNMILTTTLEGRQNHHLQSHFNASYMRLVNVHTNS